MHVNHNSGANQGSVNSIVSPSYGGLHNGTSYQTMDNDFKMLIGTALRIMRRYPEPERTWSNIVSAMMQEPIFQLTEKGVVDRTDRLIIADDHWFKFDASPDAAIVEKARNYVSAEHTR